MQFICTLLHTDNHGSTSSLNFYRPDALSDAQPTVSTHWSTHWLTLKFIIQLQPSVTTPISKICRRENNSAYWKQIHKESNSKHGTFIQIWFLKITQLLTYCTKLWSTVKAYFSSVRNTELTLCQNIEGLMWCLSSLLKILFVVSFL